MKFWRRIFGGLEKLSAKRPKSQKRTMLCALGRCINGIATTPGVRNSGADQRELNPPSVAVSRVEAAMVC